MSLSVGGISTGQYMQVVQEEPMLQAQKEIIDTINERAKAIFLGKALGGSQVRWRDLIVKVPEILATEAFLKEIHQYVARLFNKGKIGDSHICISDAGRTIEFHSNTARPRPSHRLMHHFGEPDLAAKCQKRHLEIAE